QYDLIVTRYHRLASSRRWIDDREPSVSQPYVTVVIETLSIGSSMRDCIGHSTENYRGDGLPIQIEYSGDTTHLSRWISARRRRRSNHPRSCGYAGGWPSYCRCSPWMPENH